MLSTAIFLSRYPWFAGHKICQVAFRGGGLSWFNSGVADIWNCHEIAWSSESVVWTSVLNLRGLSIPSVRATGNHLNGNGSYGPCISRWGGLSGASCRFRFHFGDAKAIAELRRERQNGVVRDPKAKRIPRKGTGEMDYHDVNGWTFIPKNLASTLSLFPC